jgi:putative heme-binding domain-containing protein
MPLRVLSLALVLSASLVFGETNESVVRMLVPGFTVQELPAQLPNLNNLRFAPDGRLFALGYDGRIHVLRDSDGDGLEDKSELFWDQTTISVPVGMALAHNGVYVSSHGKVSFLTDTNGDGKADSEKVLAQGWPPTDVGSGGVDATAVTLDRKGSIYFGLIAADYSNPYRVKDGVSHYDLKGQRGTIQKLSADHQRRETIANGIRVPYALAFNKAGDLFCTDQEGETWCPNGNPLDELNHIIPGRNYGFPPRHEKWLPSLVSEIPVIGFGPQHQSACGMVFNEPTKTQKLFGPKWWEGDLFVAGESRGKIWRVRLARTPGGYRGQAFLLARLTMLTTDVAISPRGDLYVSCHSGEPDWGTGPKGAGKIFKISYRDPKAPLPVLARAVSPTEVLVTFDKPLDPAAVGEARSQAIQFGEFVSAADSFERLKPPYKVVQAQQAAPRGNLKIISARLADPQTLQLSTDPHPLPVTYALTLPAIKPRGAAGAGATLYVDYDLGSALTQKDWLELVRRWPHEKEIARSMQPKLWTLREPGKNPYPFIHPDASLEEREMNLAGGDYERGRSLFFGDKIKCATCHRIRQAGATTGPDLSNLASRDASSVLRDIREPSASINPDYVAYNITTASGTDLTGLVRAQDQHSLRIIGADGKEALFQRSNVLDLRPSNVSLMPAGLIEGLNEAQVRDLLTFLVNAPPERTAADLQRLLSPSPASPAPLKLVLVASKQDHGTGQHDYPAWQKSWRPWLARDAGTSVSDAWLWPSPEQFNEADVLVFYYWNRDWNAGKFQQLDAFLARGGGIVALHSATIGNPDPLQLAERIGLAADSAKTKYLHTPIDLSFVAPTNHPITRGLPAKIHFLDEPYWPMLGDTNKVQVLATADQEGAARPIMWTFQKGKGRVFASIFGHYTWTLDDPLFRLIILRAIGWAGGQDANRLEGLATADRLETSKR